MKKLRILFVSAAILILIFAIATVSYADGESEKYGITTLSEKEAYVYGKLAEGINKDEPDTNIKLESSMQISVEELYTAFTAFVHDHPECFWVTNGYTYSTLAGNVVTVKPTYTFDADELAEAREKLGEKIDEILGGMAAETVFDKALYLHDEVAKRVSYEEVGHHQTAYGALVDGKAVCAGYAAAYQLLLQKAGICAYTVTGFSNDPSSAIQIPHAWNLVWLDDSTCVYTDVTWDDQGDSLYRYYFNLSYDEIKTDHFENAELFDLPECEHSEEGFFDKNGGVIDDSTSPDLLASLFGEARDGARSVNVYYKGDSFDQYLADNVADLYTALGGGAGSYGYSFSYLGREYHLTITGNFPVTSYFVDITAPDEMYTEGKQNQAVECESEMESVIFYADGDHYFPESYSDFSVNGITVSRITYDAIRISGTPTADTVITLPSPTPKEKKPLTDASFYASGERSGLLANLSDEWLFSIDGGINWNHVTDSQMEITNVKAEYGIRVINPGTSVYLASDEQLINVEPVSNTVPFGVVKASGDGATDGKITGVDESMEYRREGESEWTPVSGTEISDLGVGVYHLRYRASGSALASEYVTVKVKAVCAHANVDTVPEKSADCLMDGCAEYKICLDCGDIVEGSDEPIKGDHSFGDWITVSEASFGKEGECYRECNVCGEREDRKIPPMSLSDTVKYIVNEYTTIVYAVAGVILLLILTKIIGKKKR